MLTLPPANTPLNQHSLGALELWLTSLGAERNSENLCVWNWVKPQWSAEITIQQEDLVVVWDTKEKKSQFGFPYGLSREDVEAALNHGP